MDISNNQDEVFAPMGQALYQFQALEYALANLYAEAMRDRNQLWADRLQGMIDERRPNFLWQRLEDLMIDLDLPGPFLPRIQSALLQRSWLLHQFFHDLGKAAYDADVAGMARTRLAVLVDELVALVSDLNEMWCDRLLAAEVSREERLRVDHAILHYLECRELF